MNGFLMSLLTGRAMKGTNNNQQGVRGTCQGSVAVAQFEPTLAELARAGLRFGGGCQVIANGIAPVSAIPTTTATLALFNGEADGGRSYLIHRVHFCLGSGTPAAGATLFGAVSGKKITAPSAASNYSTGSLSRGGKTSKAVWATAQTFDASTVWLPLFSTQQLAAANVGQGDGNGYLTEGGILVPPGYAFGLAILSGAGTSPLYAVGMEWTELELDLE